MSACACLSDGVRGFLSPQSWPNTGLQASVPHGPLLLLLAAKFQASLFFPITWGLFHFITLFFTDESENEIKKIFSDYAEGSVSAPSGITRGLYFRGIK